MTRVLAKTTLTVRLPSDESQTVAAGSVVELDEMAAQVLAAKNFVEILTEGEAAPAEEATEPAAEGEPSFSPSEEGAAQESEVANGEDSPDRPAS